MLSRIDTVLFDLDGTLTQPIIDFAGLRRKLNLADGVSITHALNDRPVAERDAGFEVVREAELQAAREAVASKGAVELVQWLHEREFATGIITRNFQGAVDITLQRLEISFDVVITRDCAPPKPAPDAVHEALLRAGRTTDTALMVGDYQDDIQAGKSAGATTCFVTNGVSKAHSGADLTVTWLSELHELLLKARD